MKLLTDLLEHADPAAPYMHFRGATLSYGETIAQSQKLARALAAMGVGAGDRVAIMLSNRPELILCFYACWKLGAIAVPLNTRYQRREAAHALEHSAARALICESRFFPIVGPLCRKDILHEHTVLVDGRTNGLTDFPDWEDVLANAPEETAWPTVMPESVAGIYYTSGSTAMPKGVTHTHHSLLEMTRIEESFMGRPELRTAIAYLPMCYIGALLFQVMHCAYGGRDFVIIAEKSIDDFLDAMNRYPVTDTCMLPTDLINILEHPATASTDWSSLLWLGSGGDKVPLDAQRSFRELTGLEVTECYGMTEAGVIMGNPAYGPKHLGTLGLPFKGVECALREPEGNDLGNGPGEIWIKSPAQMKGYWNNPQATAETIVGEWVRSGDLATKDADGYYTFVGRSKLIIVHGGSNISPQEVEEVIDHHPAVSSCCVVGVPDPKWGETVKAYVVLHGYPGPRPTAEAIILYARQRLALYKCPEQVVFLDRMPYTPTGKMDRQGLRRRAAEEAQA